LGFTWIELVAVRVGLMVLVALLLPAIGPHHRHAPQMQNSTQLRAIHQGLVIFAQSNKIGGGEGFYPGLDYRGEPVSNGDATDHPGDGTQPHVRMWMMLKADVITGRSAYFISPNDDARRAWDPNSNRPFVPKNHSYAMLKITGPDGGSVEWKETMNTPAVGPQRSRNRGRS
jgi:hypothetical protein